MFEIVKSSERGVYVDVSWGSWVGCNGGCFSCLNMNMAEGKGLDVMTTILLIKKNIWPQLFWEPANVSSIVYIDPVIWRKLPTN